MEEFVETLKRHIAEHPPNFGDGESVLSMLYECHNENKSCKISRISASEGPSALATATSILIRKSCISFVR